MGDDNLSSGVKNFAGLPQATLLSLGVKKGTGTSIL
jgi:hypothetical protein